MYLVVTATTLAMAPGAVSAQGSPPPVFVEEDCPFECCQYGQWTARAQVTLVESPERGSTVVATIERGDTVVAERGEVRTVPRQFVVSREFEELIPGDTIWLLNTWRTTGRGFAILVDGEFRWSMLGLFDGGLVGEPIGPANSAWWVHMTLPSGLGGWTTETDAFGGKDGCACQ